MLIKSQTTTLFQIVCELVLYPEVIFKSMRVAGDVFNGLNITPFWYEGI